VFAYPESVRFFPQPKVATMPRKNSLQAKIEERIADRGEAAYLTREFNDLGDERQVLRALAKAVAAGMLVRLGYGVYGPAVRSTLTGQPVLAAPGGFVVASRQALTKLGVPWEPGEWEKAYNEGRSTQVPVNGAVRIGNKKFARRLAYGGRPLVVER
jgi:hypothetical protein